MAVTPSSLRTGAAALVACAVASGCQKPDPPDDPPPPAAPAVAAQPIACPAEVRLWLIWHGYRQDDALAEICDKLDKLGDADLRSFDRQSPSHISYRDIRADIRGIVSSHGARVTVRDLHLVRDECIGRWQTATHPAIP